MMPESATATKAHPASAEYRATTAAGSSRAACRSRISGDQAADPHGDADEVHGEAVHRVRVLVRPAAWPESESGSSASRESTVAAAVHETLRVR